MFEAWWVVVPVGGNAGKAFWAGEDIAVNVATKGPGQTSLFFWDDQSAEGGIWREYHFAWNAQPPSYDTSMGLPQNAMVEVSGHYPPVFVQGTGSDMYLWRITHYLADSPSTPFHATPSMATQMAQAATIADISPCTLLEFQQGGSWQRFGCFDENGVDISEGPDVEGQIDPYAFYGPVVGQTSLAEVMHLTSPPGSPANVMPPEPSMYPPMGLPGALPYMTAPDPYEPPTFSPWGRGMGFGPTAYELQNASSPWAPGADYPESMFAAPFGPHAPWGAPAAPQEWPF